MIAGIDIVKSSINKNKIKSDSGTQQVNTVYIANMYSETALA